MMSVITDKKFINLVSPELRNFKWKKESKKIKRVFLPKAW